jgi:hypothetical protein
VLFMMSFDSTMSGTPFLQIIGAQFKGIQHL